jgi:hypothetical protein
MKLIINAEPEQWGLAIRAAKWLTEQPPEQRDGILTYGERRPGRAAFYVRRNKASITVQECPTSSTDGTK